jgi:hypothetical protein
MYCCMPDKDDIELREGMVDNGRRRLSDQPTFTVTLAQPSLAVTPPACPPDDKNGKTSFCVTVTTEFRFQYPAH